MSASANETSIPERQPSQPEPQLTEFAHLLRLRREAAGLSRRRLANLAHLSEATIKFIETARTRPTRATLLRLLLVSDLRLLPTELPLPRRDLPFHLASLPSLLQHWLPDGRREGNESTRPAPARYAYTRRGSFPSRASAR